MRVVVTFAVRSEMGKWRPTPRYRENIRIVRTGIGMRGPQDELKQALSGPVDFCIASGLAGSLKRQYPVGSVLVARGIKSEGNKTIVPCDGGLVDAAVRNGARAVDFFHTSPAIANSEGARAELARAADAVDMESFHVLSAARRAGVPAVAVRVISDSPDRKLPLDFSRTVTGDGQISWARMIGQMIKHPGRLPAFVTFGIDSSAAIRNLSTFLDRYVNFLMTTEISLPAPAEHISR